LYFPDKFSQNNNTSIFITIRQAGAQLSHADEQTDRHEEGNSRFSKILQMRLKMGQKRNITGILRTSIFEKNVTIVRDNR